MGYASPNFGRRFFRSQDIHPPRDLAGKATVYAGFRAFFRAHVGITQQGKAPKSACDSRVIGGFFRGICESLLRLTPGAFPQRMRGMVHRLRVGFAYGETTRAGFDDWASSRNLSSRASCRSAAVASSCNVLGSALNLVIADK